MENWKPVVGYEGLYEVSDMGRVRSLDKWCPIGKYGKVLKKGRVLKQAIRFGYCIIKLYKYGGKKTMVGAAVHRLVAEAFIPNPENKPEVNHKKAIKSDNRATELEWATRQENMDHAVKFGLLKNNGRKSKIAA